MGGSMRSTCSCFAIFALLLRSGAVDGDVGQGAPDESEEGPPLSSHGRGRWKQANIGSEIALRFGGS